MTPSECEQAAVRAAVMRAFTAHALDDLITVYELRPYTGYPVKTLLRALGQLRKFGLVRVSGKHFPHRWELAPR